MVVIIRLELDEAMMQAFKEKMGSRPSRNNVKESVTKMFKRELFPDGAPEPKRLKFKLTKSHGR